MNAPKKDKDLAPLAEDKGSGYSEPPEVAETPAKSPLEAKEENPFLGNKTLAECLREQNAQTDSTGQYTTKPIFASQLETEPKLSAMQVTIFDLSKSKDLMEYQLLKTSNMNPGSGMAILAEERKWSETTENWKVYVESATILYRLPANLITKNEND